jgi:hypothetical protein
VYELKAVKSLTLVDAVYFLSGHSFEKVRGKTHVRQMMRFLVPPHQRITTLSLPGIVFPCCLSYHVKAMDVADVLGVTAELQFCHNNRGQ